MNVRTRDLLDLLRYMSYLALALLLPSSASAQEATGSPDYYRVIQPILVKNCITCHGPGKQESGYRVDLVTVLLRGGASEQAAVVPRKPLASHLVQRITSSDKQIRMPPKGSGLDSREIQQIQQWIARGAIIPRHPGPSNPLTDHWAFQQVQEPRVPMEGVFDGQQGANEVDRFVGRRLRQAGLRPSPRADRYTLLRRVYLVMLGLPPTQDEVRQFMNDTAPGAYARLVERVLASQHYGERWAQHWLDCVRYAETTGYEINGSNGKIYPYRDYVIRALNADRPYDRFLKEQIAGDQLGVDAATGFLVVGPHDVNKSPDPRLTSMQYQDGLDEIIKSTSAVMLGITLGCARCHDHKYDPLTQRDYYGMQAVFAGTRYGSRREQGAENDQMQQQADRLEARLQELRSEVADLQAQSQLKPPIDFREYTERFPVVTADAIRIRINAANDNGIVELDDIEVWSPQGDSMARNWAHRDLGATATSSPTAKANQGKSADLLLDGQRQLLLFFRSTDSKDVWIKIRFAGPRKFDRIVIKPRGSRVPVDYRIDVSVGDDQWEQVVDSRDRFIHRQDRRKREEVVFNGIEASLRDRIVLVNGQLREVEETYNRLRGGPQVFAGRFVEPAATHLMVRGDPLKPGPKVVATMPGILGGATMEADTPEKERRMKLAETIAHPENPLTARVIVNRVWHHTFGTGIVDTPSDFGINGGFPTHPELLDWLASYLVGQRWSLKQLHRKILMSSTFQQASVSRPRARQVDFEARLLWRFPPRRLEAEVIRDSILVASGKLNRQMYGPSFEFFVKSDSNFAKKKPLEEFSKAGWRRMIYGKKIRLEYVGVFGVFDCPDASQMAPSRSRSTTAIQALGLLNSKFVNRQAAFLATSLSEKHETMVDQVRDALLRVICRPATEEELEVLVNVGQKHGLESVCRILLNLNEFVFLN